MWYFDRMEKEKHYDLKTEYFPAVDAVTSIADAQRKWDFRNRLGNDAASVLLAITPKFMLDNPELFIIPEGLDESTIRNQAAHGTLREGYYLMEMVHRLADANSGKYPILCDYLREAGGREFSEILGYAFVALDGQDFNIQRHPTLLYRAFIANVDRIIQRSGKAVGDYYTETWIADLMSSLIDISDGDKLYDNVCGIGILASIATVSTGATPYVQDVNFQCTAVAQILLLMAGKTESVVSVGDSMLDASIQGRYGPFNKFLIDAPFGIKTTKFKELLGYTVRKNEYSGEVFSTDPTNDQWIFIRQAFKVLAEQGKGAAIVNLSMLSRDGRQYQATREEMVNRGFISAVIELPANGRAFTGVKYSIVVFDRSVKHENIYFVDLSSKGAEQYFMRNRGKVELRYGDSDKIAEMVKSRQEVAGVSKTVSISEIAENGYRLSVGNYIEVTLHQEEALRAGADIWARHEKLRRELHKADEELEKLLKEYKNR